MSLPTIYIQMTSKYKIVSLSVLTFMLCALSLPAQTAFAATQTVAISGPWRTYTPEEEAILLPGQNINALVGGATDSGTNPQNVGNPTTGWTPNGATDERPEFSRYVSSIIAMQKCKHKKLG